MRRSVAEREHVQKRVPICSEGAAVDEDKDKASNRREAAENPVDVRDPANPLLAAE